MSSKAIKYSTGILAVLFIFLWITVYMERPRATTEPTPEDIATTTVSVPTDNPVYKNNEYELSYPKDYQVATTSNNGLFDKGVSFLVPPRLTQGTNLSDDSRIYVVTTQATSTCIKESDKPMSIVRFGNNIYDVSTSTDAGAGNLYETSVYSMQKDHTCYEITTFIHSTNIANYPLGQVKEFDRNAIDADTKIVLSSFKAL